MKKACHELKQTEGFTKVDDGYTGKEGLDDYMYTLSVPVLPSSHISRLFLSLFLPSPLRLDDDSYACCLPRSPQGIHSQQCSL